MSVLVASATTIHLESHCLVPSCEKLAERFRHQLGTEHYSRSASVMPVPSDLDEWRDAHRTARKRADRSERLGYWFDQIDRSRHNEDIYEINTSLAERQGRPMAEGYLRRVNHGALPHYPCNRHRVHTYGVLRDEKLVAYLCLYRVGELALVSMILGHGDHLRNDIMYLLFAGVVEEQAHHGGTFYYNRHDSGTDGLRYYKERVGFRAGDIEWML